MAHPFKSERLLYRAVEPEDEAFFHRIAQDAFGMQNAEARISKPVSKAQTKDFMKQLMEEMLLSVVICLPATSTTEKDAPPTPIGQMHLIALPPHHVHMRHTDIALDILPEYQRQGYGSEAIRWVLRWAFMSAGMHRIGLAAFEYNPGAAKLYERLGFTREGVMREGIWHEGRFWDEIQFGMLAREWREKYAEQDVAVR
ncbi:hypothetical protein KC331_g8944 [Hortaea werneckii]|uniref:N-acetyltransferase domain-containing protein n=1 Tax=Hortaea werneckii TaxID=91943 RepID=A0A3M7DB34_HORWE|nr:hypothetical protein KC331_g8944 [Hortaea werneckii]KAI7711722.1 hypothetical protein KC353_g8792 [Hortaea werneckii]RMY61515.1 hypothetical protein D0865_00949 [Hortaea werneckii]